MFKKLFNPIGFLRDLILAQFPFKWSDRELQEFKAQGITDEEVAISVKVNQIGMPFWVKRTIK